MKFSVHDLQDSPTVLLTNKNDTEDVELTFNLISKVCIVFQEKPLQHIIYSNY